MIVGQPIVLTTVKPIYCAIHISGWTTDTFQIFINTKLKVLFRILLFALFLDKNIIYLKSLLK